MDRVDVAIIGAGLAGLAVAAHLEEASVLVLEAAPTLGQGDSGREDGLVRPGLLEHPGSLLAAMGPEATAAIYRLGVVGLERLHALGLLARTGVLALAAAPGEDAENLAQDAAALRQLGLPAAFWSEAEVAAALGPAGLGAGRWEPLAGLCDPAAVLTTLAARARAAGAVIRCGAPIARVLSGAEGHRLLGPETEVEASVVVYAAGASLCDLDAFFQQTVLPYRQSHLLAPGTLALPVVAGHGLNRARPHARGVLLSGARWVTPHLEAWERDAATVPPAIEAALLRFGQALCPDLGAPLARWASIQAHTCDNLPLVGPLPGSPTEIALTGWCGQDLTLALAAGMGVAEALRTGRSQLVPSCFAPIRMV